MVYNYKIKVTLKGFEKIIKRTFVINDKNNDWDYDYDDFDINRINNELDKKYNMRK